MENVEELKDFISELIFKHTPYYWEEPPFQKNWDFRLIEKNVFGYLTSEGIQDVDATAVSRLFRVAIEDYLHDFSEIGSSLGSMRANPRIMGLRKEESYKVAESLMGLLSSDYQTQFLTMYGKILSPMYRILQKENEARDIAAA